MPNGVKRARDVPLAEKIKDGETWQAAVVRAVKEELGSVLPLNPQVCANYNMINSMLMFYMCIDVSLKTQRQKQKKQPGRSLLRPASVPASKPC